MRKFLFLFVFLSLFLFNGCLTTTGFKDFYEPWYEDNFLPTEGFLNEEESPKIIQTSDLESKFREISSQWYWCIGYSGFNGAELSVSEINTALNQLCTEKKAKVAIWAKEYTDTRNGVYSVPHTNYHSYTDSYGFIRSYTTTSYSTSSYSVQRYDFSSYLFVEIPDEYKLLYIPGFSVNDLSQKDRDYYKQNTGCLINIVYMDTVAYYANLFNGDIITNINGITVRNTEDFYQIRNNSKIGDLWEITYVRNGIEKKTTLLFGLF